MLLLAKRAWLCMSVYLSNVACVFLAIMLGLTLLQHLFYLARQFSRPGCIPRHSLHVLLHACYGPTLLMSLHTAFMT